jgi:GYF domain 2
MQWYVSHKGKTTGPFDKERLAMLVQWGRITRDAFICDEQCSAWLPIGCSAFAQLLPHEDSGAAPPPGARPGEIHSTELEKKQALGLVALSVILAGFLMAAL